MDESAIHNHDQPHELTALEITTEPCMTCGLMAHTVDLQEYNYKIQYIPGKENGPPDALSHQPGVDKGQEDNQGIVVTATYLAMLNTACWLFLVVQGICYLM
jgi:hypothetical protein